MVVDVDGIKTAVLVQDLLVMSWDEGEVYCASAVLASCIKLAVLICL